jgi:hypothetical protein
MPQTEQQKQLMRDLHLMGYHQGRYHTGRCSLCAREYRRIRRAAGKDVPVRLPDGTVTTTAAVAARIA